MLVSSKVLNKKFYNVEFEEKVLSISRVVKVVKGGRIFSFSVLVVIGNKNGCFGVGLGKSLKYFLFKWRNIVKSLEINDARKKAINNAKKNLYQIVLTKDKTVPHVVVAKSGSTQIVIRPAQVGRGVIAGGAVRTILECLGVKDVVAKCIGSSNVYNLSSATVSALLKLKSAKYYNGLSKKSNKNVDFNNDTDDVVEDGAE